MKWVKVGDYVVSQKGKKPRHISQEKTRECSIPYVNIKAFEKKIIDEYTDGVGCVFVEDGEFLMVWDGARSGYVGKSIRGALGSTLVKLSFPKLNNNYAYYFLQSKYFDINTRAKGVGIPHVDPNILWNYDLLIPSTEMQQAIVSKIEELFSELDKGIENLRIVQQQLKIYRQAVLKSAFEGKLTNENVKDGKLPKDWKKIKLAECICGIKSGKSYKCEERPPNSGELGIVKVSAVTWGNFNEEESKTCFSNEMFNPNYLIKKGDFLFSRANTLELVGACVIVNEIHKKLMLSDKTLRFTFSADVLQNYILYFLRSKYGRKQIETLSSGNQESMRNIGHKQIMNIEFPFCNIEEQGKLVKIIESRLSVADKVEESIVQSLHQAVALRQSILKRAFEGKLV